MPPHASRAASIFAACLVVILLSVTPAPAQSPDAVAAAKQLMTTMKSADQFKAILPALLQALKPAVAQNRPDVERDYDALVPVLAETMNARVDDLLDKVAAVYAKNFSADELKQLDAFYRGPLGQKFVQKLPAVTQESLAIGQDFGRTIGTEMQQRMIQELRKRGHNI
jgi:hypothetical protein